MLVITSWIFAELLAHYQKKWKEEQNEKEWEFWEECEEMRKNMGHSTDIVKVTKRKPKNSHRKHRY